MKEKQSYRIAKGIPTPPTTNTNVPTNAPKPPTTNTNVRPIPRVIPPAVKPGPSPAGRWGLPGVVIEIFRRFLDAGPTAPPWQDQPNPVTGKPNKSKTDFDQWNALGLTYSPRLHSQTASGLIC
jgi:hypothetical protein